VSERRFYAWFTAGVLAVFFAVMAAVNSGWLAVFFDRD
jgi:hypothetical protein